MSCVWLQTSQSHAGCHCVNKQLCVCPKWGPAALEMAKPKLGSMCDDLKIWLRVLWYSFVEKLSLCPFPWKRGRSVIAVTNSLAEMMVRGFWGWVIKDHALPLGSLRTFSLQVFPLEMLSLRTQSPRYRKIKPQGEAVCRYFVQQSWLRADFESSELHMWMK